LIAADDEVDYRWDRSRIDVFGDFIIATDTSVSPSSP
jgi:hypothetical protein